MPRRRAACRFALASYPLSQTMARGVISGPMSARTLNCGQSLAWLPVRWKSSGRPCLSHLMWILVPNPPRDRPRAWLSCPLLPPRRRHAHGLTCCRTFGSVRRSGCTLPAPGRTLRRPQTATVAKTASRPCSRDRIRPEAHAS
jgi:hypothetical protein